MKLNVSAMLQVQQGYTIMKKTSNVFCLLLNMSITTKPMEFSIFGKRQIGPKKVLGYFIFSFWLFPLIPESLPLRIQSAAANTVKCIYVLQKLILLYVLYHK